MRSGLLLVPIGLLLALGWLSASRQSIPPTRLVFLQVGQGDGIVFQAKNHTVLIDCGPRNDVIDAGEALVVPQLYDLGVRQIDAVLISHPDADHIGGLVALNRYFPIRQVAIPACFRQDQSMLRWLDEAGIEESRRKWIYGTQHFSVADFDVRMDTLTQTSVAETNNGSMFVRITGENASAVLTGDAPVESEYLMMRRDEPWTAQVLKAGHHGSRSSSSEAFLKKVKPRIAVISCGRNNVYGHPHPTVMARLQALQIPIARTDLEGNIEFRIGPDGFTRRSRVAR